MASRILIADDHEMVRKGIRSLLESSRRDVQVIEAGNGREAVERTIDSKPDLVILDVSMPLLDGFSAAREIRKVADTPILIFTFEKNDALAQLAQNIGISGFVTKGENSDALLRAIDAAIGSHTGQTADSEIYRCPSTAASPPDQNSPVGKKGSPRLPADNIRGPLLRVLLLHSRIECIERCLPELNDLHFQIEADVALTSEQCNQFLKSRHYDIVLAEYPIPKWQGTPAADLLRRIDRHVPIIFVIEKVEREVTANLIMSGASDCVEMGNLDQLPVAIRRALKENTLRGEHNRVEKKLQRSEAHYRALMGNLAFGICRCGMEGQFVDVNRALVTMLGYESKEELVGLNLTAHIFDDPVRRAQLLGEVGENGRIDPLETTWRRKDGTGLMVRLSGREVNTDDGKRDGYEIIVEDVTKQRVLENQLRQQAAKDPLTGLANYRHLLEVLNSEIRRFNRTGREFALLLFDLDGLKQINDRYGHLVGSEALCRLADVLTAGCRNIDTAARFGGDEFALVLPETGQVQASLVAQRIRECFANDGREPRLSVSVGVAIYPDDGEKVETLLGTADTALYAMKDKNLQPRRYS